MGESFEAVDPKRNSCDGCVSTGCAACPSTSTETGGSVRLDRRQFGRTVAAGSVGALFLGRAMAQQPAASTGGQAPALDPALHVVQQEKGPIMTVLEEFYKMGPGPSSSHTMGPMRITYDFFQRISKLPPEELKKATALKVHLYGSLSATATAPTGPRWPACSARRRPPARRSSLTSWRPTRTSRTRSPSDRPASI